MAKVWFARDGNDPNSGGPVAELPLAECVAKLDLKQASFIRLGNGQRTPRFGMQTSLDVPREYRHVVVEIEATEATANGWKAGFYRVPLSVNEAKKILDTKER